MRALTLPPWPGPVPIRLDATTRRKFLSRATSSRTPPLRSSSATRVQSVTARGAGSPEATPSANSPERSSGALRALERSGSSACGASTTAPAAPERVRN